MNIDMLTPMIGDENELIFMNFLNGKSYNLILDNNIIKLKEASDEVSRSCLESVQEQQKVLEPELPVNDIWNIVNLEKEMSEQNKKHIFRRGL